MPLPDVPKASASRMLRRFRRNRSASAAVEFALIAPVFFALLFAIIETATMFFASQVLETMTQDSARMLSTGQAQSSLVPICQVAGAAAPCTQATFKQYVCSQIPALFDCDSVYVDVESYPPPQQGASGGGFASVTFNSQIDNSGNFVNNMQYSPGLPCYVVQVRLFYQWPLFVTGLGYNISNLSGNKRLLSAAAAFKNEPYNGSCTSGPSP